MIILVNQQNIYQPKQLSSFRARSGFIKPILKDSFERSSNILEQKGIAVGIGGIIGGILAYKSLKPSFEQCMELKDKENFEEYKNSLIKFFKDKNYDKTFISYLEEAMCKENLTFELDTYIYRLLLGEELLRDDELDIMGKIERKEFSSELDKFLLEDEIKNTDLALPLLKLVSKTDEDNEILKIKSELKQKYGQKNLFFNNDLEFAQACKEAFEILAKNKIPYKGVVIAYDALEAVGICLNSTEGNCVVVNKESWQREEEDLVHVILHELLHSLQPYTLEFKLKDIPIDMIDVADNVSSYAAGKYAHEVHCELYVKRLLEGLSDEEEELFNYLGGAFLK